MAFYGRLCYTFHKWVEMPRSLGLSSGVAGLLVHWGLTEVSRAPALREEGGLWGDRLADEREMTMTERATMAGARDLAGSRPRCAAASAPLCAPTQSPPGVPWVFAAGPTAAAEAD
jgi:hypothetical protein